MLVKPLITLTMSAAVGFDAQEITVNAANIGAIHPRRCKTGFSDKFEVKGTYICFSGHDFIIEEDYAEVVRRVNEALQP